MAIASTATRNELANKYGTLGVWISLHTSDPGTTGANEASGGSPAYARQRTDWSAAVAGAITGSEVTIDAPAGTYTHAAIWSAATGGTFIDKVAITSTVLGSQGQIKVTPKYTQS